MSRPTCAVTVVMPVWNGERFIRAALDSLLAQTFSDFIVLVIDDASVDATREIVAGSADGRVRLLCMSRRAGPAEARNLGLEQVRSRYVAFMDSDDVAEPCRLEMQMDYLRRQPGTRLVAARLAVIDERGHAIGQTWGYEGPNELLASSMLFRNYLPTSTIVLDRAALGSERFDPTLPVASDYDLWARIVCRTEVACLPDALVQYRTHEANLTHTCQSTAKTCLQQIAARQLTRLGVPASPADLAIHRSLGSGQIEGSVAFLDAAKAWLKRLEIANTKSGVYPPHVFRRVIAREWLDACDAAARNGCWGAWPAIAGSTLTRQLLVDPGGRGCLAPLPWRTLRGYVRRRWPRLGPRVRALLVPRSS